MCPRAAHIYDPRISPQRQVLSPFLSDSTCIGEHSTSPAVGLQPRICQVRRGIISPQLWNPGAKPTSRAFSGLAVDRIRRTPVVQVRPSTRKCPTQEQQRGPLHAASIRTNPRPEPHRGARGRRTCFLRVTLSTPQAFYFTLLFHLHARSSVLA